MGATGGMRRMSLPYELGPMPVDRTMKVVDERIVAAPLPVIFQLAADVERWPTHLAHYRFVRFHERRGDGGGLVEMSANRDFVVGDWPTWWTSLMRVTPPAAKQAGGPAPSIRFRHVKGITRGMEVEWEFAPTNGGTLVRIVHVWNGPTWPLIGELAARGVIGPVFVHGIASRTLAGLAHAAERKATDGTPIEVSSG
jgi:ribosome-associated toxin RatA of RatAB toxin-antitoxin module